MNTENQPFEKYFKDAICQNKYFLAIQISRYINEALNHDLDLQFFDDYVSAFEKIAIESSYGRGVPIITDNFITNFKRLWLNHPSGIALEPEHIILSAEAVDAIQMGCIDFMTEKQIAH